ncbi:MAG: bifunctional pyr operon transcriptional regulator/uracil phosphoribosyltransferase PyrR [Candidatus Aminicenantes bacterium]|nr:bifunctional pyr operon transcriptional regulator/uracil phosphoribosyltransferase PyrR [Candidatus Aminicenantes bacterium]
MEEKIKARVMDARKIKRSIQRMTTEITERNRNLKNLVIIGIRTRGVHLAKRVNKLIKTLEGIDVLIGVLDITLYRDDFSELEGQHMVKKTEIDFSVAKKDILLVDDVLFTGRTIRAAMDSLIDLGRPKTIQLLVLIDRGHRELPIRADYVGKVLPTSKREIVQVHFKEIDEIDEVLITEPGRIK